MSNAENGARIKAWAGSGVGSGIVKNITFKNFIESKVDSPIVIDQVLSFLPLLSSFESLILMTCNLSAMKPPIAIVRNSLQTHTFKMSGSPSESPVFSLATIALHVPSVLPEQGAAPPSPHSIVRPVAGAAISTSTR